MMTPIPPKVVPTNYTIGQPRDISKVSSSEAHTPSDEEIFGEPDHTAKVPTALLAEVAEFLPSGELPDFLRTSKHWQNGAREFYRKRLKQEFRQSENPALEFRDFSKRLPRYLFERAAGQQGLQDLYNFGDEIAGQLLRGEITVDQAKEKQVWAGIEGLKTFCLTNYGQLAIMCNGGSYYFLKRIFGSDVYPPELRKKIRENLQEFLLRHPAASGQLSIMRGPLPDEQALHPKIPKTTFLSRIARYLGR